MNIQKIPQSDSIQELAQFWDNHDLTDFDEELEEVTEPLFQRESVVQINLHPQDLEVVKKTAQLKGISDTDLIREWILEKIRTA